MVSVIKIVLAQLFLPSVSCLTDCSVKKELVTEANGESSIEVTECRLLFTGSASFHQGRHLWNVRMEKKMEEVISLPATAAQ